MKIAIIAAMEEEIIEISNILIERKEININKFKFILGKYKKHDIIVAVSGIGKVSASMLFSTLIQNFKGIKKVINIGVAGGVLGKTSVNDIVVANKVCYHDVDLTAFSKYSYGELPGYPKEFKTDFEILEILEKDNCLIGTISSGDKFMIDKNEVLEISKKLKNSNIFAFDMESAAFAQCAFFYKIPFTSIRAISDVIGETAVSAFDSNLKKTSKTIALLLLKVLEKI